MPDGRKIDVMYARFGVGVGICGNCPHFVERIFGRRYFKCEIYGLSYSEATDWRKNWLACGLIGKEAEPGLRPVIETLQRAKEEEQPIDGQITMNDIIRGGL